jgi:hypothetical protein
MGQKPVSFHWAERVEISCVSNPYHGQQNGLALPGVCRTLAKARLQQD